MIHIYIVSLKQDIKKRESISKTLKDFDLEFSFVDAIYGKELSENALDSIRSKSVGTIISRGFAAIPGEIGCTLSHIKAYQQLLSDQREWACILEDDVILDKRFKVFINTFKSDNINPKDLHLMGGQSYPLNKYIIRSRKNNKYIGEQKFYKTIRSQYLVYRTCCYLISSEMANELISLSKAKFILADDWGYLKKNKYINRIYLSDFVEHPLDLSTSHLQKGREQERLPKKTSYAYNVKGFLKRNIRYRTLKIYSYIEKKDKK
ncbi:MULTISPECIES: glycosyltransferase family 25 protein [unclassified Psychrobacter]|uniref:glycosyltransferase family 25 protein n=1 Tax=unclassified Psychrobacter TaxID=196806 RepID=UPI003FD22453